MTQSPPENNARLTARALRNIFRILRTPSYPIFPDLVVVLLLPVAIGAYLVGGYFVILAPGNLYKAIVSEDWPLFRTDLANYAIITSVVLLVKVLRGLLREVAANYLRKRLTDVLHDKYFGGSSRELGYGASPFYRIVTERAVDNPDQRIVADARDFSSSLFDIMAGGQTQGPDSGGFMEASASIVFYTFKTLGRTGWYGVGIAYLWSLIVASATVFAINRTSPAVFRQEKLEADFRYGHTELRRHAEEVALLRGAPFERSKLADNLNRAVSNTWIVIYRHMFLNMLQYGFGYYISIIMYLALALAIHSNVLESSTSFSSSMTPGEKARWISQTGGIFIQLLYSFTMTIQLGTAVSGFVSNANRLSALLEALADKSPDAPLGGNNPDTEPLIAREDAFPQDTVYCDVSEGITARSLTVRPGGNGSVGPVSFTLEKGQWVLLHGATGCGKSSIVRVLRGLWVQSSGQLRMPTDERAVMFIPQHPYISAGVHSLREVVMYPNRCTGSPQETRQVASALQAIGWRKDGTLGNIDEKGEWSARLSPGEAQLIAAARVLMTKPAYVVMDEPTASLDAASEERLVRALRGAGMSGLTVGHSKALAALHDKVVGMAQ